MADPKDILITIVILGVGLIIGAVLLEPAGFYTSTTPITYNKTSLALSTATYTALEYTPVDQVLNFSNGTAAIVSHGNCTSVTNNGCMIDASGSSIKLTGTGYASGTYYVYYRTYKPSGLSAITISLLLVSVVLAILFSVYLSRVML